MDSRTRNLLLIGVLLFSCGADFCFAREEGQEYPDFIEEVFLTEETAVKKVFPKVDRVEKKDHILTPQQIDQVETSLGWVLSSSTVSVYEGFRDSEIQGYAVISEEVGKFKPITFIVKVSKNGKVEQVEVMVYREPVGSEVKRKRFTRQFRGKTVKSPLRINRDIINITGATMSVQAMTAGVKKVLTILKEIYFKS